MAQWYTSNLYISLDPVFTFVGQLIDLYCLVNLKQKKTKVFQCCYEWSMLQRSGFHEASTHNGANYRAILHGFLHTHMPQDEI